MNTSIIFPEPCRADWSAMTPDGRARFCADCGKHVHDLTRYTPEEADDLLAGADGPACLRALVSADGEVSTLPSRTGRRLFAAVMPVFVALAATSAQAGAPAESDRGAIGGMVTGDGGHLTVTVTGPGIDRSSATDATGRYRLRNLPPGTYALKFVASGGRTWTVEGVPVRQGHLTVRDVGEPPVVLVPSMATAGVPLPPPPRPEPKP